MSVVVRRKTVVADVGGVGVGGDRPIVVQSMTNTDTADVERTVAQVSALAEAGSEVEHCSGEGFAGMVEEHYCPNAVQQNILTYVGKDSIVRADGA